MRWFTKWVTTTLAVGALTAVHAPPAAAQTFYPTEMKATCNNVSCSQVLFELFLTPALSTNIGLKDLWINLFPSSPWSFSSPPAGTGFFGGTRDGSAYAFFTGALVSGNPKALKVTLGPNSMTPVTFKESLSFAINMTGPVNPDELFFTYNGRYNSHVAISGTVAPEPASLLLLGTGLAGLGGAVRRRRRRPEAV